MAKVDYSDVPEVGSKWDLDGLPVVVERFQPHGKGGYVYFGVDDNDIAPDYKPLTWSEWRKQAKAA